MDSYDLYAALEATVRWFHVFSAILWIGQTYLFNFMERSLEPDPARQNIVGKLWMVHGGGFYLVEKQRWPELMPMKLHWFKWEAAATWVSGALLLAIAYYFGDKLIDPGMSYGIGVAAGIGSIIGSWILYDALVRSPLGQHGVAFAAVGLVLLMAALYGLGFVLSSRAAFIHVGAMVGTIMAANVWDRILPAER